MKSNLKNFWRTCRFARLNTAVLCCGLPLIVSASDVPPKKILFVGDSISVGVGASSPQKRFTSVAVKMLNQAAGKTVYQAQILLGYGRSRLMLFAYLQISPSFIPASARVFFACAA